VRLRLPLFSLAITLFNSDHPGPINNTGQCRGQGNLGLDIFEAEEDKDKDKTGGQVVSQVALSQSNTPSTTLLIHASTLIVVLLSSRPSPDLRAYQVTCSKDRSQVQDLWFGLLE